MTFYNWSDDLSIGVLSIDNQHKKLVSLINSLFDAMGSSKSSEVLGKILSELIQYTKSHFSNEEGYMKKYSYPKYGTHKIKHDDLIREVLNLNDQFQSGRTLISIQVMNFLKDWLNNHIIGTDKEFGNFLKSKGVV